MVRDITRNSHEEGRFRSRLPSLDGEWKEIIRGSADFFGLNYYSSSLLELPSEPLGQSPSFERDLNVEVIGDSSVCDPAGLESLLHWIKKEYNNIPMIVTENGWRDEGEIEDYNRTYYLKGHLQAVLNAVNSGCNVYSYTHWSLLDNFEWVFGYTQSLGLYGVDRTSPLLERYAKKSARFYKKVIEKRISPNQFAV
ncbi:myrosinase 1-like [Eupeodes corollae]|uniref:myrosinase 1-like n=1 Tax=Eupeodes corollae TaxID=290404 RepID=UPI0024923193|nr:myrosinase 1-like [Eupeodes corollae]